jgi:hypothetical protein
VLSLVSKEFSSGIAEVLMLQSGPCFAEALSAKCTIIQLGSGGRPKIFQMRCLSFSIIKNSPTNATGAFLGVVIVVALVLAFAIVDRFAPIWVDFLV